jgi:hypothetical protein
MKGFGFAVLLGLLGCSSEPEKKPAPAKVEPPLRAQPWERDPYTRTSEVLIDGALVGYLVEYQPIPAGASADRAFPTGTSRIQDLRFEDVGYITPRGDVRRFVKSGGSESLGVWRVEEGLRRFYGSSSRTVLRELQPAPPPKPLAAEKDAGEGEKAEEGQDAGTGTGKK